MGSTVPVFRVREKYECRLFKCRFESRPLTDQKLKWIYTNFKICFSLHISKATLGDLQTLGEAQISVALQSTLRRKPHKIAKSRLMKHTTFWKEIKTVQMRFKVYNSKFCGATSVSRIVLYVLFSFFLCRSLLSSSVCSLMFFQLCSLLFSTAESLRFWSTGSLLFWSVLSVLFCLLYLLLLFRLFSSVLFGQFSRLPLLYSSPPNPQMFNLLLPGTLVLIYLLTPCQNSCTLYFHLAPVLQIRRFLF